MHAYEEWARIALNKAEDLAATEDLAARAPDRAQAWAMIGLGWAMLLTKKED